MEEKLRQKKVARVVREALAQSVAELFPDSAFSLLSITRVHMTVDLRTANVFFSIFGSQDPQEILSILQANKGPLRKSIASKTKLKYNPMLIFSLDPTQSYEEKIDRILDDLGKNEE
ncbi:MAG: ribosome-binding factor A [Candidatus Aminicenantes bacterium]|nr:ribosome-binding factor A [Candidatus Aminicenantes bacterium]